MQTVLKDRESFQINLEEAVFRKIFDLYKEKIYSFSLYITHAETVAEDITQEVFLKLWLHRKSLDEITNKEAWLVTIARNLCYNQLKKMALEQKFKSQKINKEAEQDCSEFIFYKERVAEVTQIINRLPAQQQIIFNLKQHNGLKNEEIAHQLNISKNTVKSHFYKALNTLRQKLQSPPTLLLAPIFLAKLFF